MSDVVRLRLDRLLGQALALLSIAAWSGLRLSVLERAAGLDGEQRLEAVEGALSTGVLVEDVNDVGRLRFAHDLVREPITEELQAVPGAGRRKLALHVRPVAPA